MLDMGLRGSGLPQPEMITSQHYAWLTGIAGCRSRAPGGISLHSFQPADQVPGSASDRGGPGGGVGLFEVQPSHASDAGHGLASDLDQIVLTGKSHGAADNGVLGSFRNGRPAPFRSIGGRPRMTGHQPTPNQEAEPENLPASRFGAYAARDGEEPYAWIQVHADLLRWSGMYIRSSTPARMEPTRTYAHCKAEARPVGDGPEDKTVLGLALLQRSEEA